MSRLFDDEPTHNDPAPMPRPASRIAVETPVDFRYTVFEIISRPMFFVVLLFVGLMATFVVSILYDALLRLLA